MTKTQMQATTKRSNCLVPPFLTFMIIGSSAACTTDTVGKRGERTGLVSSRVGNGTFDDGNVLSHTGFLQKPDGVCSGFLATRRMFVTASHCVDEGATTATLRVFFQPDPRFLPVTSGIAHTSKASGDALPRLPLVNGGSPDEDIARDVGVIKLDVRVDESLAATLRPAGLNNPDCETDLDGTLLIGYGPRTFNVASGGVEVRNFAGSDGWNRETYGDGFQTFENTWVLGVDYRGGLEGDSGGPFLDVGRTHACGVASSLKRVGPSGLLGPKRPVIGDTGRFMVAALDSADNKAFLRDILLDKDGDFVGEKPGTDTDGDGTADVEDNCPFIANRDQADGDGDGIGDACDGCRELGSRDLPNSNEEAEKKFSELVAPRLPDICDTR